MSEFKFACPVCGQHISAASSSSGTQLDCPTCFRRIVVPQAPAADSKLILSAAQPAQERPKPAAGSELEPLRRTRPGMPLAWGALALVLVLGGVAGFYFRAQLVDLAHRWVGRPAPPPPPPAGPPELPPGVRWTLDLEQATFPDRPAAGRIHGEPFTCELTTLTGGSLNLRQGRGWPPTLAIGVVLPVQQVEQLSGRTVRIRPDLAPPVPRIIVRWKSEQQQEQRLEIKEGYALKISFGQPANRRMPGKIFLALPDEARSVVAGTFEAEIRAPRKKQ